ncbi:MAG: SRPBCC family protein [bacterium]|nr:SRPBCC family protein [bacterium]
MKILRMIGIGVGVLLILLVVVSFFLPNKTDSEVELTVSAPPAEVFALIVRLQSWPEWTAWGPEQIHDIEYSFEGPEEGVGAIMHWSSEQTNGSLTIESVESDDQGRRMHYSITMENGSGAAEGDFTLTPFGDDGRQTKIVWRDAAEIKSPPVLNRLMTPLMQSMMDEALAKGLQGIQAKVEN